VRQGSFDRIYLQIQQKNLLASLGEAHLHVASSKIRSRRRWSLLLCPSHGVRFSAHFNELTVVYAFHRLHFDFCLLVRDV